MLTAFLIILMLVCLVIGALCFMMFDQSDTLMPGIAGVAMLLSACSAAFLLGRQ